MSTTAVFGGANTASSPWIDYNTDIAYVGTDDGKLYKISPVFGGGAPTVVSDTNWPVAVWTSGTSKVLTDPIVDDVSNRIFMGDFNGYLYAINLSVPAKATSARVPIGWVGHGAGTGVVDPPIVVNDSANPSVNQVFAFTGCSNVVGIGGAVNQIPANFTSASSYVAVDMGRLPELAIARGETYTLERLTISFGTAVHPVGISSHAALFPGPMATVGLLQTRRCTCFPSTAATM